ncbi:hypothetical protein D9M68_582360 [compost metagenome]
MSLTNTHAPAPQEAVRHAIRKAYDDGYNDAKMAPDNCSTYCGQRAEREGAAALLSKLRAPVAVERAAQEYGSPADVAQRIEQYLAQDGRMNSGTQLLYEAMKALRGLSRGSK